MLNIKYQVLSMITFGAINCDLCSLPARGGTGWGYLFDER